MRGAVSPTVRITLKINGSFFSDCTCHVLFPGDNRTVCCIFSIKKDKETYLTLLAKELIQKESLIEGDAN